MCAYYSVIIPYHTLKIRQMETSLLQIKFYYLKECIYMHVFKCECIILHFFFFTEQIVIFYSKHYARNQYEKYFFFISRMYVDSKRNQNVCLLNMYCIFDLKNPLIIKQNLKLHTCTMVRLFSYA